MTSEVKELREPRSFRCSFCKGMTSAIHDHYCGVFFGRRLVFRTTLNLEASNG